MKIALLPLLTAALLLAVPAQSKTVLVFSQTKGFRHKDGIDKGNPILKRIAEENGYSCVVSEDPAVFDPDKIGEWDVIVFNNCTGRMLFTEPERLDAFMKRIREDGAGFMGFHAATDCFYDWPEYGKMINGYFRGHPWNQTVLSRIEEPEHPLMTPFEGKSFEVKDEIYQFRDYKRSDVRVLMSIDPKSINVLLGARDDRDYAMCWIRPWGNGRVYYNAHGHYGHVFESEVFQRHIALSMKWAAGDLSVDTSPSAEIDRQALAVAAVATLRAQAPVPARNEALDTLAYCPHPDALPLVLAQLQQAETAAAAAGAVAGLCRLGEFENDAKIAALRQALPTAVDRVLRKGIRTQLMALGIADIPVEPPPGFVAHYWVAGPLNTDVAGGDEFLPASPVDPTQPATGDGKTRWKKAVTDDDAVLNLNEELGRRNNCVALLFTEVTVPAEVEAQLRLGSDDGFALWLNGEKVGAQLVNRALKPGADQIPVRLRSGANQIVAKVFQGSGDWAFCLQLTAPDGAPLTFESRK